MSLLKYLQQVRELYESVLQLVAERFDEGIVVTAAVRRSLRKRHRLQYGLEIRHGMRRAAK